MHKIFVGPELPYGLSSLPRPTMYYAMYGIEYRVEQSKITPWKKIKATLKVSENPSQNIHLPTRSFLETCLETAAKLLRFVKFDQLSHNYNRVKVKPRYSN